MAAPQIWPIWRSAWFQNSHNCSRASNQQTSFPQPRVSEMVCQCTNGFSHSFVMAAWIVDLLWLFQCPSSPTSCHECILHTSCVRNLNADVRLVLWNQMAHWNIINCQQFWGRTSQQDFQFGLHLDINKYKMTCILL